MVADPNPPTPDPNDPFGPPPIPTLVHCLHCNEEYESWRIEYRHAAGAERGFWCCPMPGCSGKGFRFDIWPVDPEWRDEDGNLVWVEDEHED